MSPDDKSDDSTSIPKELRQQIPKRLAEYIIGLLGLTAIALLQKFGDSAFDAIHHALGSKLLLQLGALLLCSLAYCIFLILRMKRNKLIWKRRLYWAKGDIVPFCSLCHEKEKKNIHLYQIQHIDKKYAEAFACPICFQLFAAEKGKNFEASV